jgi:hypothetical protein
MKTPLSIFALLLTAGVSWPAQAVNWISILNSDDVLGKARSDISKLTIAELQLFADSIARCQDSLSQNELIRNECDVARERYAIEYDSERTLDQLLNSIWIVTALIRSTEAAGKPMDVTLLLRLTNVEEDLKTTTNRVFYIRHASAP